GQDDRVRPGPRRPDRRLRAPEGGGAGAEEPLAPRERAVRDAPADLHANPDARRDGTGDQDGRAAPEHLQVRLNPPARSAAARPTACAAASPAGPRPAARPGPLRKSPRGRPSRGWTT